MCGHIDVRYRTTPRSAMAAPCMMVKAHRARPPVTQILAVGDPKKGNRPSTLLNRTNRNRVQKKGTYLSACFSPSVGRTTSLRMNVRSDSKAFHHGPLGSSPL